MNQKMLQTRLLRGALGALRQWMNHCMANPEDITQEVIIKSYVLANNQTRRLRLNKRWADAIAEGLLSGVLTPAWAAELAATNSTRALDKVTRVAWFLARTRNAPCTCYACAAAPPLPPVYSTPPRIEGTSFDACIIDDIAGREKESI